MLSQRSRDCPHFFSFFFLYSVPQQCFPAFCLPVHLSVICPRLFCYWFLLVHFSFQLLYFQCCLLFKSSRCLLNISCIFLLCASMLFWDLGSSLLSFLQILFLSPLHLAVFLVFYLIASSGTYLSAVSFYLTFCFLLHRLQDYSSSFFWCLPLGGYGSSKGLVQTSWWEGLVPAHCWVELGLVPLVGRAFQGVCVQEDFEVWWWVGLCFCPVGWLAWASQH